MSYALRYERILKALNNNLDSFQLQSEPRLFADLEFDSEPSDTSNLSGGSIRVDKFKPTIINQNSSNEEILNDLDQTIKRNYIKSPDIVENLTLTDLELIYSNDKFEDSELETPKTPKTPEESETQEEPETPKTPEQISIDVDQIEISEESEEYEESKDSEESDDSEESEESDKAEDKNEESGEDNDNTDNITGGENMKNILTDLSSENAYIEGCKATTLSGGNHKKHIKTSFNMYPYV